MLRIGLTGGIASGKTTVANLFARLGVPIIDTDKVARALMDDPAIKKQVISHFGDAILDDEKQIARSKLRKMIFDDAKARQWLESVLHPKIRAAVMEELNTLRAAYCIIVIPLLNAGTRKHYPLDHILVVDCSENEQIERVMQRDHIDKILAQKMIDHQLDRQSRLQLADTIISNRGNLSLLQKKIGELHQKYLKMSAYSGSEFS